MAGRDAGPTFRDAELGTQNSEPKTMEELVEFIVRSLVDYPDEVSVEAVEGDGGVTYEVSVAQGDAGKVIGRGGRIIQSIRAVVKAAAAKTDQRVYVEVIG